MRGVLVGRGVDVAAEAIDRLGVSLGAHVRRALEHHVLEHVGGAAALARLVLGARVGPDLDRNDRRGVIAQHGDLKPVRQHKGFDGRQTAHSFWKIGCRRQRHCSPECGYNGDGPNELHGFSFNTRGHYQGRRGLHAARSHLRILALGKLREGANQATPEFTIIGIVPIDWNNRWRQSSWTPTRPGFLGWHLRRRVLWLVYIVLRWMKDG